MLLIEEYMETSIQKEIDVLGRRKGAFDYTDIQGGLGEGALTRFYYLHILCDPKHGFTSPVIMSSRQHRRTDNRWEAKIEVFHSCSLYRPLTKGLEISPSSREKGQVLMLPHQVSLLPRSLL